MSSGILLAGMASGCIVWRVSEIGAVQLGASRHLRQGWRTVREPIRSELSRDAIRDLLDPHLRSRAIDAASPGYIRTN